MEQQTIAIDAEVAAWLEKQPKKSNSLRWQSDPLTDAKILAGWPVMDKGRLAKALGIYEGVMRRRWAELTQGKV